MINLFTPNPGSGGGVGEKQPPEDGHSIPELMIVPLIRRRSVESMV